MYRSSVQTQSLKLIFGYQDPGRSRRPLSIMHDIRAPRREPKWLPSRLRRLAFAAGLGKIRTHNDVRVTAMNDSKFRLERVRSPVSDQELISDMRRIAQIASSNVISFRLYSKLGTYHPSTVALRFGTWNKALIAAGLEIANERDIADERLFENLMRLWEHYCRQPRFRELTRPPSVISSGPYQRRFGSWMKALERFVAYANAQDMQPPAQVEAASGHKTGRDPSLRLRFRVMKRDNFSCRACGASPSLNPGLSLHVDHIKAWSLGGETVEGNLQTLCDLCNLGKSNVL